jgi:hypothetical protein
MRHKLVIALITVLLLSTGLVTNVAYAQPPNATVVTVTEDDIVRQAENTEPTNNWVLYTRTAESVGTIEAGPGNPPIGANSLHLSTPTGGDKVFLFNFDYTGTPLSSFDAIGYDTYRTNGDLQQLTALNIVVDENGPDVSGGFTTLVFEPVYNTDQGAVVSGSWQSWDAYNGGQARWWSTRAIPGVCAFDCFIAWDTIVANNPNATVLGALGINQGSGNPNLVAAVDAFTLGVNGATTVYDFDVVTAGDLMDNLQADTADLITNPIAERALLATLSRAEMYMDANRPMLAYLTMLQYVIQVQRYQNSRLIPPTVASQLIMQARDTTRAMF